MLLLSVNKFGYHPYTYILFCEDGAMVKSVMQGPMTVNVTLSEKIEAMSLIGREKLKNGIQQNVLTVSS